MEILASELFEGYPESDLLPLSEPIPGETVSEYRDRTSLSGELEGCGDTLFIYLLRDLCECAHKTAVERLEFAVDDLLAVLAKVRGRLSEDAVATDSE